MSTINNGGVMSHLLQCLQVDSESILCKVVFNSST